MRKRSLSSIENEIKNLKKIVSPEAICVSFIETTDEPCTFKIYETKYSGRGDPTHIIREVTAATLEQVAEQYCFPNGCNSEKSILFLYDFGEWGDEIDEV